MDVCGARHEGSKGQDANSMIYCMLATQIFSPKVQTVLTLKEIMLSELACLPLPPLITPTDLTLHYERCLCFLPFSAATTLTFSDSEGLGGLGGPSDPTRNRRP